MKKEIKLSVVLATFNEEKNIADCLFSVKELADEIVIVDGSSMDKTVELAKTFGAKVTITDNPAIFHINKQKALDLASGEWVLQLDADERVGKELAREVEKVINMSEEELEKYEQTLSNEKLFLRHQKIVEERDGKIGTTTGLYSAFFVPRLNYFLGKFLRHGGVYPDGVIRLVRRGKAWFPAESVHEQIAVDGRVGWLNSELIHLADPNFERYWRRNNQYINLIADDLKHEKVGKNPFQLINYFFYKPIWWFLLTQIRHKGILDGYQGIVFSFFSSLRFPRAYWRYLWKGNN